MASAASDMSTVLPAVSGEPSPALKSPSAGLMSATMHVDASTHAVLPASTPASVPSVMASLAVALAYGEHPVPLK